MPHSHGGHGHSHGPDIQSKRGKADIWTRLNQAGEYLESTSDVFIYSIGMANMVNEIVLSIQSDDMNQPTSNAYKYSVSAGALLIALILSVGSAYCHGILNQQFQDGVTEDDECEAEKHNHAACHHHADQLQPLLNDHAEENFDDMPELMDDLDNAVHVPATDKTKTRYGLSGTQKFSIATDALCHTVGRAGSMMAVIDYATSFITGRQTTPMIKLITQCGATLFATSFSVAEVRTCRNSLIMHNREELKAKEEKEAQENGGRIANMRVV